MQRKIDPANLQYSGVNFRTAMQKSAAPSSNPEVVPGRPVMVIGDCGKGECHICPDGRELAEHAFSPSAIYGPGPLSTTSGIASALRRHSHHIQGGDPDSSRALTNRALAIEVAGHLREARSIAGDKLDVLGDDSYGHIRAMLNNLHQHTRENPLVGTGTVKGRHFDPDVYPDID